MGQSQNIALLVVDVQRGFINRHTEHIPGLVETLLGGYQHKFATQFYNPDPSNYRALIGWQRFSRGSEDCELAFKPDNEVVLIQKPIYSCVNPSFLKMLGERKVDTVHICGIDTDICVTKCAVDLFETGLTPYVLADFSASHAGAEAHQQALVTLGRFIGKKQII